MLINRQTFARKIATFYLILMCIQYILIEGYQVSLVKFGAMCLCPVIFLCFSPKSSRAVIWGGLYFLTILFSGLFNFESFRLSTVGYALSFIVMFITYYNLVYCERVFALDGFIRVLKGLILAYSITLVMQQMVHLAGIESFPLINTYSSYGRGFLAGNSLSLEPSHSARIMLVLFLGLLRMYEVKLNTNLVTLPTIFCESKWVVLGFFWSMLTMGSGTAFIGLMLLSLYWFRVRYAGVLLPLILIGIPFLLQIEFEPLQRALKAIEVVQTLDYDQIYQSDMSASARILPFIYTLEHFDIMSTSTWFGEGIDTGVNNNVWGLERMIGGISDYGFLAYIFSLVLVFKCCIRRIFSVETLIFFILLMGEIRSVYVWWFVFMVWATVKYFQIKRGDSNDFTVK